jgi:hypothetical protein
MKSWGWNLTIVGGKPKTIIVASIVNELDTDEYGMERFLLFLHDV